MFFHCPGSQKFEINFWAGLSSLQGPPSYLFQLLVMPAFCWLMSTSLQPQPLSSPCPFPLCFSVLNLQLLSLVFFFFFPQWGGREPHLKACEILVPQAGIEPRSLGVKAWSLNHWIAREVTSFSYKDTCHCIEHPP